MRGQSFHPIGTADSGSARANGKASIREIQEAFRIRGPHATIQTTVYRLENKKSRASKISNAHILSRSLRDVTRHGLLDEILSFFGGRAGHDGAARRGGKLTREDVRGWEADRTA